MRDEHKCPLCGNHDIKGDYRIEYVDPFCGSLGDVNYTQTINFCQNCNMIFTKNPIKDTVLDAYYKYMSQYEAEDEVGESDNSAKKMFERQRIFINSNIRDYDSVLEIGAATGENLVAYKKDGKRVLGIEPSENNKKYAKEHYGISLEAKSFNEWYEDCDNQTFDLIFFESCFRAYS